MKTFFNALKNKALAAVLLFITLFAAIRFTAKKPTAFKTVDDSEQKSNAEKLKEQDFNLAESKEKLEEVANKPTKKIPDGFKDRIAMWNKGD